MAQVAFEAVLAIAEIFSQLLQAFGIKHGSRAVAVVEALVHLRGRRRPAVALRSRRDHERVVRLRVACGLGGREVEHHAGKRRIERPRELHAGKFGSARSVATGGPQAAATTTVHALRPGSARHEQQRCGKKRVRPRDSHTFFSRRTAG